MAQGFGETPFVEVARKLRLAKLDKQIHQCLIALLAQSEQLGVDGLAVGGRGVEELALRPHGLLQRVFADGESLRALQKESFTHPLARHEEHPVGLLPFGRAQEAAQRPVLLLPVLQTPQLEKGVALSLLVLVDQQVPGQAFGGVSVRFHPGGTGFSIQQKG